MSSPVTRLAIAVVYHLTSDDDLPLLELHLDRIAHNTAVPFTIHAATNRASGAARELLQSHSAVRCIDIPTTHLRGSREHGYYLDALVASALDDGATHVCTLDVDSFPIRSDWVERIVDLAPPTSGVVGVLRRENGDIALPHPSCTFLRRDFVERFAPSFSPDSDGTPDFRRFLHSTRQPGDTGIRIGYTLWSEHLPWGRLLRTNVRDPHPIIAGLYGDCVFHLGATASGTVFRRDLATSTVHRATRPLERVPLRPQPLTRAKRTLLDRLRAPAEAQLKASNRAVFTDLRAWLLEDPDGLVAYLSGNEPCDTERAARLLHAGTRCLGSPRTPTAERSS
jgi:hypothetical protein